MARKAQSAIAKSIPAVVTDSTLATLESTATTESATQGTQHALRTGTNFSGQYLYDRFISNDEAERSKMDIVRQMVHALDLTSFKKIIADFVNVPKGLLANAIDAAKKEGTYDKDAEPVNVSDLRAKYKTAQNHQSVMRLAYGALKFCADKLESHGYTDATGYQVMRVIAKATLSEAGLNWDGSKVAAKTDKAHKEAIKLGNKAFEEVAADNPQGEGESRLQWLTRIDPMIEAKATLMRQEAEGKMLADLTAKVKALCGPMLDDVLDNLLSTNETPVLDPKAATEAAPAATKH